MAPLPCFSCVLPAGTWLLSLLHSLVGVPLWLVPLAPRFAWRPATFAHRLNNKHGTTLQRRTLLLSARACFACVTFLAGWRVRRGDSAHFCSSPQLHLRCNALRYAALPLPSYCSVYGGIVPLFSRRGGSDYAAVPGCSSAHSILSVVSAA